MSNINSAGKLLAISVIAIKTSEKMGLECSRNSRYSVVQHRVKNKKKKKKTIKLFIVLLLYLLYQSISYKN